MSWSPAVFSDKSWFVNVCVLTFVYQGSETEFTTGVWTYIFLPAKYTFTKIVFKVILLCEIL